MKGKAGRFSRQVIVPSLLLNFNGSNGSTTFTDSSENSLAITSSGGAQISTAESKFGGASGLFDGSGDYLSSGTSSAFAFSGAFTIEAWIFANSWPTYCWLTDFRNGGAFRFGFGRGRFYPSFGLNDFDPEFDGDALPTGEWVHVAFVYDGTNCRMYANGVLTRTITEPGMTQGDCQVVIGSRFIDGLSQLFSQYFNGYIDDLRIVNGKALYEGASFTPPAAQL